MTKIDVATDTQALREGAARTGYACQFEALRRKVPWRPVLLDDTGARPRPRPTALGPQTAIVVGPQGQTSPQGADELHTDALGRIKVKFNWQANPFAPQRANSDHSCWVRVVQRAATAGGGHQFIPRIGQEVLVGFLGNDIDRPVVIASLYNGRGASGVPATPGGAAAASDTAALAESTDHRPSSQMNQVNSGSGGYSPAWHGAAPGAATEGSPGQANAAALSGVKSKEFGGNGHNQLVLDDTPEQLRTQHQTWLQMGHLLHQADNLPNALADAADRLTRSGADKVPHTTDPDIALIGKAGIGLTAGQDLHLSSGDTTQIASGQDTHWAVGGQARVQTGQAIGVLAGAIQPGADAAGKGLTLIAAQGPIDLQAQAGPAQVAAKQTLELKTASGVVNIAAAKKVVLAVSGGASITIEGGSFTAQCPGKITVKAGVKSMVGPGNYAQAMNAMPGPSSFDEDLILTWPFDGKPVANRRFEIVRGDGSVIRGATDAAGKTGLQKSDFPEALSFRLLPEA